MFKFLSKLFSSPQAQSGRIAKICAMSLKELGLNVGGNVFQLTNSKGVKGWLVSLQVPENFKISPVDALALRFFLARQIESALNLQPKSLGLVVSFSNEARKLPMSEASIDGKWIKARIPVWMNGVTLPKAASNVSGVPSSRPGSTPSNSRSPGVGSAYSNTTPIQPAGGGLSRPGAPGIAGLATLPSMTRSSSPPPSASADEQTARVQALLAELGDDEHYEVHEASMTDFDRALEPDSQA